MEIRGQNSNSELADERTTATTTKRQLDERQVNSTPDALKYTPGVYVQQTGHGQGSPYIRGRTGQQILYLFDGLRLNHALFRKGPNQYLFTVDSNTVSQLSVVRGSASVDLGNDAISGAILIKPIEPKLDPTRSGLHHDAQAMVTYSTADDQYGGRLQLDAQYGAHFGIVAGVGGRIVGQLEAGGNAFPNGRAEGQVCEDSLSVPCFESDGRTQIGTGFDEITADARFVYDDGQHRLTTAAYIYRQFDAPRTDQCPAPEAAVGECLIFEEQFRTHVYQKLDSEIDTQVVSSLSAAMSYQRQHQRHSLVRPDRNTSDGFDTTNINGGRDSIDGVSGYARFKTAKLTLGDELKLQVRYGLDGSYEWVDSLKWIQFIQPPVTRVLSRGQYVADSTYLQAGSYLSPSLQWRSFKLRTGVRTAYVKSTSPGDESTGSLAFDTSHTPVVTNAGLRWGETLVLIANVEQGFRVPNLDDLVARQSTGQGYQLDNPDLKPERALTVEGGFELHLGSTKFEALAFHQRLSDAIERRLLTLSDCELAGGYVDQACRANRAPLQLTNLSGTASIYGGEARLESRWQRQFVASTSISYAYGEGDHPNATGETVPLSRIPPLNGNAEMTWYWSNGAYFAYAMRWAKAQTRLSIGDVADARIPLGGTPGFVVHDLRFGLRLPNQLRLNFVLQNLSDERYRTHGSGVFASGRSFGGTLHVHL